MSSPQDLKIAAGEAPWQLLHCPRCKPKILAKQWKTHARFCWGLQLACPQCHVNWTVCRLCSKMKAHMVSTSTLGRHQRNKHPDLAIDLPTPINGPDTAKHPNMATCSLKPNAAVEEVIEIATQNDLIIPEDLFNREQSRQYFQHELNGNGNRYLCSLANFGRTDMLESMNEKDVNKFLKVAQFVLSLTRPQREEFAGVFGAVLEENKTSKLWSITIPMTPQQIRSTICEGKNSLFENLPYPMVHTIGEYAYTLPSECIRDIYAHGHIHSHSMLPKFEKTSRVSHGLGTCAAAQRNMYEAPNNVPACNRLSLSMWSDGFEPNYSKLNRGSAWIKTMTIHTTMPNAAFAPITHVYPLIIGPKGNDHDLVENKILQDLEKLKHSVQVYDGAKKALGEVTAQIVCILQDQPERRSCNRLMLGNSNFHAQFGVSFDFYQAKSVLRPCPGCLSQMKETISQRNWNPPECQECTNWCIFADHPLLRFKPPDNFPMEETLEEQPGYLQYRKLDFGFLKVVAKKAHTKIVSEEWSVKQATAFLRVYCFNAQAIAEIKLCAANCLALCKAKASADDDLVTVLMEDVGREPRNYYPWETPVAWNCGVEIPQYCEIAMHQLFKGIVSTLISNIQEWLAKQRKYEEFTRKVKPMTDMCRELRLSWLRVEPYVGKELGGWVSENYLGFARIMPWAYCVLEDLDRTAPYIEPEKEQKRWTKAENTQWLSVRGLVTSGTAVDLRSRVAQHISDGAPPVLPPSGGPVESIHETIVSLHHMLSHLMGMKESSEAEASVSSRLIRLFLTALFDFDANMQRRATLLDNNQQKAANHYWLSAYNHMCLLNLPLQIAELGPLRNRWEGKYMGEGLLAVVKPTLTSPNRKNWSRNLMVNLSRQRAMLVLKNKGVDGKQLHSELSHLDHFSTYPTIGKVVSDFENRRPLSVIGVVGSTMATLGIFACVKRSSDRLFFKFEFVPSMSVVRLGMVYFKLKFRTNDIAKTVPPATSSCVLLPFLVTKEDDIQYEGYYTAIDSDWRVLTETLTFDFPHRNVRFTEDMDDSI